MKLDRSSTYRGRQVHTRHTTRRKYRIRPVKFGHWPAYIPVISFLTIALMLGGSFAFHAAAQYVADWESEPNGRLPVTLRLAPVTYVRTTNAGVPKSTPVTSSKPIAQPSPKSEATVTAPPKSSSNMLPGRINPICISSHIDRLGAADVNSQTSQMQAMGVGWVRFDVAWASIEQSKGNYNWTNYDYDVNAVLAKGMKPLAILTQYGIPAWERLDQSNWLSTPNNMQDFQNFASIFAQHFKNRITLYEIGNEPNMAMFWPSGPDPAAYTQFLKAGYNGIKSVSPTIKVISAGLANISAVSYLQGMYSAGAKGYFDYVGFHPYSYPNGPDYTAGATSFSQTANIQHIMAANGQGSMQVMATEVGWPSTVASGGVDEATQAQYISRLFQKVMFEDYQYVPIVCVYDLINDGTDQSNNEDNFGILRADYSPKPSYGSIKDARQQFDSHFAPLSP